MGVKAKPAWMTAWVGLGSNMRDPVDQLKRALTQLAGQDRIECIGQSSFYRTPPWGDENQDDFVNAVAKIKTRLTPLELLHCLQSIEKAMGRKRGNRRWGPRLIDLDLLMYADLQMRSDVLQIPHPRMHERAFVLVPLSELDQNLNIPGVGDIGELIKDLDISAIRRLPAMAEQDLSVAGGAD